ncbi:hypothetical protein [Massilia sp. LjRoot122]|uniref:hypothetical protein n=1 Tax=Massilia sp. LjRoot122 TaxID=3342257 RepID=UPI003ECF81B9
MKIQDQDWQYGAVLHQIVMHPVFTTINKITEKAGLYLINEETKLLIKCSGDDGPEWTFSFTPEDVEIATGMNGAVALNCGSQSICLLHPTELAAVLDEKATKSQQVRVRFGNNESMRVTGPLGMLGHTIAHNAFPGELLGRVPPKQEPHAWPELGRLSFYQAPPELVFESSHRLLDLASHLGWSIKGDEPITVYMGVSSISHKWPEWNEERLRKIEGLIKDDFAEDGYKVQVQRHTPAVDPHTKKKNRPCSDEFVWKLTIKE